MQHQSPNIVTGSEWDLIPFENLIADSKDGEWGLGEAAVSHTACWIIRGTDFADLDDPDTQLPLRWIPDHLVNRKRLQPGDVIFEMAGGTATQTTGRSALARKSFFESRIEHPVLCASFCRHLRLKSEYNSSFIYYLLQTLYRAGYMGVFNVQHTGVSRFQYTTFKKKTVLKVPKLSLQKKIAALLSAYDELIENNRQRIALLEKLAEDIYREWFVRLRFPGHDSVKKARGIPQGWEIKKVGDLVRTQYGYTASAEVEGDGPKFLRITDIVPSSIDWKTVPHCKVGDRDEEKYLLREGDILVARTGATVGFAKRINKHHPRAIFASYLVRLIPIRKTEAIFLGLSVERNAFKEFISMFVTGAAQPQANATTMSLFPILLPPELLLEKFNKIVEPILDQKETLLIQIAELSRTRDLLLPRLISGKLSVEQLDIQFPLEMAEEMIAT